MTLQGLAAEPQRVANEKSVLWRGFDRVERTVGKPLEDAVASQRYADLMVKGMKVQRAVGGLAGRLLKGGVGKVLHVVNIPTSSDVQRLSRQMAVLTSEVRALSLGQRLAERSTERPAPATDGPAKTPTKRKASTGGD